MVGSSWIALSRVAISSAVGSGVSSGVSGGGGWTVAGTSGVQAVRPRARIEAVREADCQHEGESKSERWATWKKFKLKDQQNSGRNRGLVDSDRFVTNQVFP